MLCKINCASQDVTLNGQYFADAKNLVDILADLEYSTDINKKLSLSGKVRDNSQGHVKHYNFEIFGSHPATRYRTSIFYIVYSET
jgi:hypothetical protein